MNSSFPLQVFVLTMLFSGHSLLAQQNWYKGNTHTHTTHSDGKMAPEAVKETYVSNGYDFLFFTDEDQIAPIDSLSEPGFLAFRGEESMIEWHISCLNIDAVVPPTTFSEVIETAYTNSGFAVINHPIRGNHEVYAQQIISVDTLKYIEIFNGKSEKDGYHDQQLLWDSILTAGKLVYGVASDDFHETKHLGKGWIMVRADTLTHDHLINAMLKGDYYCSTGPEIQELTVTDSTLFIRSENASFIRLIGDKREILLESDSNTVQYTIQGNEGYIRAEVVIGSKKAWTQPLYWNKSFIGLPERTRIHTTHATASVNVYPNPVKNCLSISGIGETTQLKLFAITGEQLMSLERFSAGSTLDISSLHAGYYLVNLIGEESMVVKFLKE